MGRKVLLMLTLALALPIAAFADGDISFNRGGGTLNRSSFGMSRVGSQVESTSGVGGSISGTSLGSLALTTAGMASPRNVIYGAHFLTGGTVAITGSGRHGTPSGILLSSTFSQSPTWGRTAGTYFYPVIGIATGTLAEGRPADILLQFSPGKKTGEFGRSASRTRFNVPARAVRVPEPGSLTLMGAGLLGLAGVVRRKYKALRQT